MGIRSQLLRAKSKLTKKPIIEKQYYFGEGLESFHNSSDLLSENFQIAYKFAVLNTETDYSIPQRMLLLGWAAVSSAKANPGGVFVELGSGRGFCMSFMLKFLELNLYKPQTYLFDTFNSELPKSAKSRGAITSGTSYFAENFEKVVQRFQSFESTELIRGELPSTLHVLDQASISFLHIDLNDGIIEAECLDKLWDKILPGSLIVLDDFANRDRNSQRLAIQSVCRKLGVNVLSTPQGQGLIIKS